MTDPMFTALRQPPLPSESEFETITKTLGIEPGFNILFSRLAQRLFQHEDVADIIDAATLPPAESDCIAYRVTPEQLHQTVRDVLAHLAWHRELQTPPTEDEVSLMSAAFGSRRKSSMDIVIGMGATVRSYGDADACTVVAFDEKKGRLTLREDKTMVIGTGAYGTPNIAYEPDPNGREHEFKRDRDGWQAVAFNEETKRWRKIRRTGVEFGVRSSSYNPHV